jgi:hypothetical protein
MSTLFGEDHRVIQNPVASGHPAIYEFPSGHPQKKDFRLCYGRSPGTSVVLLAAAMLFGS